MLNFIAFTKYLNMMMIKKTDEEEEEARSRFRCDEKNGLSSLYV